jgi:uncharacterized repeat protein (TIGR01451 family)/LPXTG-motif cell wall-anchored protein
MNQETENYMSKITSLIRRAPKRFSAVIAMVAAAIIIPSVVLASWGPDRPIYNWDGPAADHVVFNSFIDNPVQGDERNFMRVREASQPSDTYVDNIALQANKEYVIHIYYHNNASTTLNDAAHNYAGVAKGAYVKAAIPGKVENGSTGTVSQGYIGATNASPKEVWDDIKFSNNTGSDLGLQYIAGSAKINNFGATNGQTLSDSVVTTGAAIGYNSLNGEVPGCNEFSGYVTFRVKAVPSSFTVQKQVRVAGQTEYKENVTAKPGDTLEYRIEYKNTGSISHKNVVVKDTLPADVSYVPGSTTLKNTNNPSGKTISDNLTTSGVNIGDYAAGGNAFVKFKAKVAGKADLKCGVNTLVNKATVQVGNNTKDDTASTTVPVECEPGKLTVCELSTKKIITIDVKDFDTAKHTTDLTKCEDTPPPVTPPELPKTGMTENIVAIVGLGALIAAIAYYVASRRALNQ